MKILSLPFLLATGLLFSQCGKTSEVAPKLNYDQKSIEIVQGVAPAVVGEWTLRRVQIVPVFYNVGQRQLGITRDTVFENFATLSIQRAPSRYSSGDPRYPNFAGFLRYKTKTYPIQFDLMASSERVVNDKGPQALLLFEYNFPSGSSHPTEPEEQFLQDIGLLRENFSLEIAAGQPRMMIWQGYNRGIGKIEMVK